MHPKLLKVQEFMTNNDKPCIIAPDWKVYKEKPYFNLRDCPVLKLPAETREASPFDPAWLDDICYFAFVEESTFHYCSWRLL